MSEQKKQPSMGQMLKNFASEVVEYAKAGAPHVSEKQYNYRLKTCDECPSLKRERMRCGECGCMIEHKAKWATSNCPSKKWPQVIIGKDGKKVKVGRPAAKKWRRDKKVSTKTGDKT